MKIKSEIDDGNLKHTEDSTALKNAILGPQPAETEPSTIATEGIPTVHSTKTEPIGSGLYNFFNLTFKKILLIFLTPFNELMLYTKIIVNYSSTLHS